MENKTGMKSETTWFILDDQEYGITHETHDLGEGFKDGSIRCVHFNSCYKNCGNTTFHRFNGIQELYLSKKMDEAIEACKEHRKNWEGE
jgi:hypothetical protein